MATILVIDDDANLLRLYKNELGKEGYTVLTAQTWEEAVRCMDRFPLDLVVLELRMADVSRLEITSKILQMPYKLPIIINTGLTTWESRSLPWPVDAYLSKSCDIRPLKDKIREIVSNK